MIYAPESRHYPDAHLRVEAMKYIKVKEKHCKINLQQAGEWSLEVC
jgi:hypothetical protein